MGLLLLVGIWWRRRENSCNSGSSQSVSSFGVIGLEKGANDSHSRRLYSLRFGKQHHSRVKIVTVDDPADRIGSTGSPDMLAQLVCVRGCLVAKMSEVTSSGHVENL